MSPIALRVAVGLSLGACATAAPPPRAPVTPLPRVVASSATVAAPAMVVPTVRAATDPPCPDASPGAAVHEGAPPDVAAIPPYAHVTASGLGMCVVRPGQEPGARPVASDTVVVRYVGWSTSGASFDSSLGRADTVTLPLRHLIRGWAEGMPFMTVGEIRRFWIPASLAYQGSTGRVQGMLVFDVELVRIERAGT